MRLKRKRKHIVTRREKLRAMRQRAHFVRAFCRPEDYAPPQMGAEYSWK